MIRISFVIPCYNTERYVEKCIASLKEQSSKELEFIFVNDGSTDHTLDHLIAFQKEDERTIVIDKENEGVSAARNDAMRVARGEYVFLLDSDDYLTPNATEIMLNIIHNTKCDILISNIYTVSGNSVKRKHLSIPSGIYSPRRLYQICKSFPTAPKLLYKRSIISNNTIQFDRNIHLGEVYAFTVQFLQYAKKVVVTSDVTYNYVMREDSAIHQPNYEKDRTIVAAVEKIYNYGFDFGEIASFHLTAFRLSFALTYYKYIIHNLRDSITKQTIRQIVDAPAINACLKKVAFGEKVYWRDRLLAIYVLGMPNGGYDILSYAYSFLKKVIK